MISHIIAGVPSNVYLAFSQMILLYNELCEYKDTEWSITLLLSYYYCLSDTTLYWWRHLAHLPSLRCRLLSVSLGDSFLYFTARAHNPLPEIKLLNPLPYLLPLLLYYNADIFIYIYLYICIMYIHTA